MLARFARRRINFTSASKSPEGGFSLIEILVGLTLIALVTAVMIPGTASIFRANLDSYARRAASMFRESRDYAILMNRVVRIAIDLDKQQYWIEDAPATFLLPQKSAVPLADMSDEEKEREKKKQQQFRMTKDIVKAKIDVPNGLRIHAVISPRSTKVITEGIAEIYYFPHGVAEPAVIQLEDVEGNKRSLVVHPITGKTRLEVGYYFPSEDRKR